MKHLTFLLAIYQVINWIPFVTTAKVTHCSEVCNCPPNKTITCSSGVEIVWSDMMDFIIHCQHLHANLSSVFTGLYIITDRYSWVKIIGCSLPNASLSDLLGSIGVTVFDRLAIFSYSGSLQKKHFENFDQLYMLYLSGNNLGILPVDTFEGLKSLEELKIELSSFELPNMPMFSFSTRSLKIILIANNISEVGFDVFNNSSGLHSLTIVGVNNTCVIFDKSRQYIIPALKELWFQSVRLNTQLHVLGKADGPGKPPLPKRTTTTLPIQLREIILQGAKTFKLVLIVFTTNSSSLQSRCFAGLPNLDTVHLSDIKLKYMPQDAFSKSVNIRMLSLSKNRINTLHENTFSDLKRLKSLDISSNRISHLPKGLFSRTKNLRQLIMSHNLLQHIEP